jgi:hypothetical protein
VSIWPSRIRWITDSILFLFSDFKSAKNLSPRDRASRARTVEAPASRIGLEIAHRVSDELLNYPIVRSARTGINFVKWSTLE